MNIATNIPESVSTKLSAIYQLCTDSSYDITHVSLEENMYIFIYTTCGEGSLQIGEESIVLKEDYVYLFQPNQRFSYRTTMERWDFWWYEFSTDGDVEVMETPSYLPRENFVDLLCEKLYHAHLQKEFEVAGKLLDALYAYSKQVISKLENTSIRKEIVYAAQNIVKTEIASITVESLAAELNISTRTLYSAFVEGIGISPKQYILQEKNEVVAYLLRGTTKSMDQIAEEVGFSNAFHLSKSFKKHYGISPYYYKKS